MRRDNTDKAPVIAGRGDGLPARRGEGARAGRAHAALTMATAVLVAVGVIIAEPASAAEPAVASVTVATTYVRKSTTTPLQIPVTVVVEDPDGMLDYVDVIIGTALATSRPVVAGIGLLDTPTSESGSQRTYTVMVESPYRDPQGFLTPYGGLQVLARAHDDSMVASTLTGVTSIRASTYTRLTATPTTVRRGGAVILRGTLRRFDGAPVKGVSVLVKTVPAGWTRGSFAGRLVTSSTGAFSLQVNAYYTGSWYANALESSTTIGSYRAAWVRVVA